MAGGKRRLKRFQKVQYSFLQRVVQKAGIGKQIEASRCLVIVEQVLAERFGEGARQHVKPKYVKQRALTLEVAHPAVGEEIRRQEESLISQINEGIGRPEIVRIHFVLPGRDNIPSE